MASWEIMKGKMIIRFLKIIQKSETRSSESLSGILVTTFLDLKFCVKLFCFQSFIGKWLADSLAYLENMPLFKFML